MLPVHGPLPLLALVHFGPVWVKRVRAHLMYVYTQLGPVGVCYDASMSCFPQSIRSRDQTAANLYASKHNMFCCCLTISRGARRKVYAQSVRHVRRSWERPVCSTLLVRLSGSDAANIYATGEATLTTMRLLAFGLGCLQHCSVHAPACRSALLLS